MSLESWEREMDCIILFYICSPCCRRHYLTYGRCLKYVMIRHCLVCQTYQRRCWWWMHLCVTKVPTKWNFFGGRHQRDCWLNLLVGGCNITIGITGRPILFCGPYPTNCSTRSEPKQPRPSPELTRWMHLQGETPTKIVTNIYFVHQPANWMLECWIKTIDWLPVLTQIDIGTSTLYLGLSIQLTSLVTSLKP